MKTISRYLFVLLFFVFATGCGGGGSVSLPAPTPVPATPTPTPVPTKVPIAASYLYASTSAGIAVFGPTGTAPLSVIHASPNDLIIFDALGNIYLGGGANVQEFAAKAPHALVRTIIGFTNIAALAIDASDNLYVVDRGIHLPDIYVASSVSVVLPGARTASRVLLGSGPIYISAAVGPDGSLYVGQMGGDITVFSPGATTPTRTILATAGTQSMVFDTLGNLYAFSYIADNKYGPFFPSKISVYAPAASVPTRTITANLGVPDSAQSLAIDAQNHLFVANGNPFVTTSPPAPYVVEYAPLSTTPIRTLTGLINPLAVAVDPVGNVYVLDFNFNTTTGSDDSLIEYAPGITTATRTFAATGPAFGLSAHP